MLEEKKNYYEVLEIPIGSPQGDILSAYQRAKISYSEDSLAMYSLLSADECKKVMEEVEEAFSILGDGEKRKEYDRVRGFQTYAPIIERATPQNFDLPTFKNTLDTTEINQVNLAPQRSTNKLDNAHVSKIQAYSKYTLNYQENAEMEQKIENTTEFNGAFLRSIREYKVVSPERLAEMTKVSKTYISYIEEEKFDKLPAEVFVRGFVIQYAKCLKLNPDLVVSSYLQLYRKAKSTKK